MNNDKRNTRNLNKVFNSRSLDFIPVKFWNNRDILLKDFIDFLKKSNADTQLNNDSLKFNHKLWCVLQVTFIDNIFYDLFGVRWKSDADLIIEVNPVAISNIFENKNQEYLQRIFESNGWIRFEDNDASDLLFTINPSFTLNFNIFDDEFYQILIKNSNDERISKVGNLLASNFCSIIQSDSIEKSINYTSKYSETITIDESVSDESILNDIVHFVTFPGKINFDQNEDNKDSKKNFFYKIKKGQSLLFIETPLNEHHNRMETLLELPTIDSYPLLPDSDEFSQSMIILNQLLFNFKKFQNYFYETFYEVIQKVDDDKNFFELISVLLILLKSHQFDIKSFTPIFMSPLFDDYATIYNYSEDYQKLLFLRKQWIYLAFGFNENWMAIFPRKFTFYKEIFQNLRKHPIGFSEFALIISQDFSKMPAESQNYLMLLMAQTNVYFYICLKSVFSNFYNLNDDALNRHFYCQQITNVRKNDKFDYSAQFYDNYNQLNDNDKEKVSALIQARFSIITFFYKNFNEIFKKVENQSFNAYQYKTFKLLLSSFFEISLQNQILSLIDSKDEIQVNSNSPNDISVFGLISPIYLQIFNQKAEDIITITFCDNLIKYLHNKVYKIMKNECVEKVVENGWIRFLFKLFPNIIIWYSMIDTALIPIDIVQLSICNTLSFITTCLSFSKSQVKDFLTNLLDSLLFGIENICLFYFSIDGSCRDLLFKYLLNLAAQRELSSIYGYFDIKYGKAILLLVKLFFNTATFEYLNNICCMNSRNCYQLSLNGVDSLLVDYLYDNRNDQKEENKELIESILQLFKTLSYQHSSEKCVEKFFSIFTPINGSSLPYYLPLFVNILPELSKQEKKFPRSSIPLLSNGCNLNVSNVDAELFNNGLSFSFWIFINNSIIHEKPILTIRQKNESDEKKVVFILNPNRKFSILSQDYGDDAFVGQIRESISEGKWHFVMISFQYRRKDMKVKFLTRDSPLYSKSRPDDDVNAIINASNDVLGNCRLSMTDKKGFSQFFNFKQFEANSKIQIFIGGEDNTNHFTNNDNNEEVPMHIQSHDLISSYTNDVILGPVGMFSLKERKAYLHYMFNSANEIPPEAIFYAYPQTVGENVVSYKFESKMFNSVSYPIQHIFYSSFIDVMIKSGLFVKLIPLFGLNDLRLNSHTIRVPSENRSYIYDEADDHYYFDYTNAAIEIFRNVFIVSETAQNDIIKINGFHIIEHLLSAVIEDTFKINEMIEKNLKANSISLDFFLYKNFVALLESTTVKNTQLQLLNDILFNFELWIKSKDFDLILNHWYISLIPDFFNDFFNKYSIVSLLTIMRLYLFYDPKEKSIIINVRKIDLDKVKLCRKIILSIISFSDRLCQIDLSTLISHATTCPDSQHVEEIIDFMISFFDKKFKDDENQQAAATNNVVVENQPKKRFWLFNDKNSSSTNNNNNSNASANKLNNLDFNDYDIILQMNILITGKDQEVAKKVIILFIKLYRKQMFTKMSFGELFELICTHLPLFERPSEFLNDLLECFCPETLSICLIVALQTGSYESIKKVIEKMKTIEKVESFCCSKSCFIWPVVSCYLYPSCHEDMIDILNKCPSSEWSNMYNSIIFVGDVLNQNSRDLTHYFLTTLSSQVITNYNDSNAEIFFAIVFHFLFMKYEKKSTIELPELNTVEITKKILSLKDFYGSNYFDIEVDDSMCMMEADLAQVVLSIYEIKHLKNYAEFIVIICAYQLIFEYHPLDRYKKFNCIAKSDAFYYYDSVALHFGRDLLTNEDPQTISVNKNEFTQKFASKYEQFFSILNITQFIEKLQENINTTDVKFKVFLNEKFHNIAIDMYRKYTDYSNMIELSYEKQWKVFWSSNSYEKNSIFHYHVHPDNVHYKRDNNCCYMHCPFKLSMNKNFDDHLKESLFRDIGNLDKAESRCKEIKLQESLKEGKVHHDLFKCTESNDFLQAVDSEETVIYQTDDCIIMRPNKTSKVNFTIYKNKLTIGKKVVMFDNIESVFLRHVRHHQTALELFERNGNSYFLNFDKIDSSFEILSKIQQAIQNHKQGSKNSLLNINFQLTCNNRLFFESKPFTEKWINGEISNFDYLMLLNIYSGRTFSDGMFYPVMPWIIQDYDSEELDFNDEKIFRDLSLPIGAVNEKRFDKLYNSFMNSPDHQSSFLYSSWLVCQLSLYVWLVRLEPFTTNHTEIQGGKFDVEKRIFHSIEAAYELCTHDMNDFRELVPEFFFQPEFLVNMNKFNLGEETNDVGLPSWCKNHFDFIYKHRKALECDHVSKNLNKWIDLIFGCKQKSEADKNVYRKELYSDIWETEFGKDPRNEDEICFSLDLLGQIPQPLFESPHPERKIISKEERLKNCEDKWPSKEYSLSFENILNFVNLKEERSKIENKVFLYSIVDRQVDINDESLPVKYYLYLYCLEFKKFDNDSTKKLNVLTYLLKYEMKRDSIELLTSSLLFVESVSNSNLNGLSISSEFIKDVSQFGFASAISNSIYLSFNLLANNETKLKRFVVQNRTSCSFEKVAVSSKYLAAVSETTNTLYLFQKKKNAEKEPLFCVCLNEYLVDDEISCITVSDEFNLCVCGTQKSSSLILVSINKMEIERFIQITAKTENSKEHEKLIKIIVTPSWGFIVVLTSVMNCDGNDDVKCDLNKNGFYRLHLYNVNGYSIGKSDLVKFDTSNSSSLKLDESLSEINLNEIGGYGKRNIFKWVSWKSFDGFDFILMADSHSVYSFEAFNCASTPIKPILTYQNIIIGLDFIEEAKKAVITLDDGRVVVTNIEK